MRADHKYCQKTVRQARRRCFAFSVVLLLAFVYLRRTTDVSSKQELSVQCTCPASVESSVSVALEPGSNSSAPCQGVNDSTKVKPKGAETLPSGIIQATSDLYPRKLQGKLRNDLKVTPKFLLAVAAGVEMKHNVDSMVKKFSGKDFSIMLFHYDGKVESWADLKWFSRAIHVTALKQTKWWFAKRFLHPDVVDVYDYLFLWDEDLGLQNFNPYRYLEIVQKYGLEISQPAIDDSELTRIDWPITRKQNNVEVHWRSDTDFKNYTCSDGREIPPCQSFVEIMAPVFSKAAWRCVWHMIQNDLSHGWGIDFFLGRCVQGDPRKIIGVVDAEWVVHEGVPTLVQQGVGKTEASARKQVKVRCRQEWRIFKERFKAAVKAEKSSHQHRSNGESDLYNDERT